MTAGKEDSGEELALSGEESLPWLEADEEDAQAGTFDTARLVGLGAILLAVLGGVVGAVWWMTHKGDNPELLAQGSTIEAPAGPYKHKPADPGGKTFAGTGDLAPAVSEGQTREGTLRADPQSGENSSSGSAQADQPSTSGPSLAVRSSADKIVPLEGIGVQVGAYGSRAKAEAGWLAIKSQTKLLDGLRHRVVKGEADFGTVYRLQAVTPDLASARALCSRLRGDGLACQVKR